MSGYSAHPVLTPAMGQFAWDAFGKAFAVVSVAEVFDKTWFVTLVLAMKHGKKHAFCSSFAGLAVHTVIAAALGLQISKVIKASLLDFMAAGLFAVFAFLYAKDCYYADPDSNMLAAGKDEASECFEEEEGFVKKDVESSAGQPDSRLPQATGSPGEALLQGRSAQSSQFNVRWGRLVVGFMMIFIAEWGDRTQIAMIGLHSSLPVKPVFFGSLLAFAVLSLSAVLVAAVVETTTSSVSERFVFGLVAASFCVFAAMSVWDGVTSTSAGE